MRICDPDWPSCSTSSGGRQSSRRSTSAGPRPIVDGKPAVVEYEPDAELRDTEQVLHPLLLQTAAAALPGGDPRGNVERVVQEGYRFLMVAPTRSYTALNEARRLTGR